VRINRSALLARGLDLNALFAGLGAIVWIPALQQQIGVAVVVAVLNQRSGMFGDAGREHVRQQAGHVSGTKEIVQPRQPAFQKECIHVEEEVIGIFHCNLEVIETQGIWKHGWLVKPRFIDFLSNLHCSPICRVKSSGKSCGCS